MTQQETSYWQLSEESCYVSDMRDDLTTLAADNIQAVMNRRGMTAPQLASLAKINPTGVYDILSGKSRSFRVDTLGKIAKALQVPPHTLLQHPSDNGMLQEVIEAFGMMGVAERRRLLHVAHAWLSSESEDTGS